MDVFSTSVSRKGTCCTQWNFYEDRFDVEDALPFSISDMDLPIPDAITRALEKRLKHPILGYSRWQYDEYLNAAVNWHYQQYQTNIKPEWITYSPSVMYSIVKAIELLTSHGNNILVFTPVYNVLLGVTKHSERNTLTASLIIKNEGDYATSWQDFGLRIKSTRVALLYNPHNPTRTIWSEEELHEVVASYTRHNVWLCSDEIHGDFVFNRSFTSVLKIEKEKVVVFNLISKTSNVSVLTGSYMISTDDNFDHKFRTVSRYRDFISSPSVLNAIATIITCDKCEGRSESSKAHIVSNIQFTRQHLDESIPESIIRPADGYYFSWIDYSAIGCLFDEFYNRLIHEDKVGIMTGRVYGMEGESYLCLNLAYGRERLYTGLTRLVSVTKNISQGE